MGSILRGIMAQMIGGTNAPYDETPYDESPWDEAPLPKKIIED